MGDPMALEADRYVVSVIGLKAEWPGHLDVPTRAAAREKGKQKVIYQCTDHRLCVTVFRLNKT